MHKVNIVAAQRQHECCVFFSAPSHPPPSFPALGFLPELPTPHSRSLSCSPCHGQHLPPHRRCSPPRLWRRRRSRRRSSTQSARTLASEAICRRTRGQGHHREEASPPNWVLPRPSHPVELSTRQRTARGCPASVRARATQGRFAQLRTHPHRRLHRSYSLSYHTLLAQ